MSLPGLNNFVFMHLFDWQIVGFIETWGAKSEQNFMGFALMCA
jgi:hypothetical protein